jgi:ligand-binding sensor domain-containing protein
MQRILIIISILFIVILNSCKKENSDIFNEVSFQMEEKILDGYFVTAINFDSKGTAWIGTYNQGLLKFEDGHLTVYNKENSPFDSAYIWDIEIDKNDNVWIGTDGLIEYNGVSFKKYDNSNSMIPENFVHSIAVDKNNDIWFTSSRFNEGGLMKFDGQRMELYTPENSELPCNLITNIVIDKNDTKWITLGGTVNEVSMIKIANNKWTLINNNEFGFQPYYWGHIVVNSDNSIVASIDYGLSSMRDISRPNIISCQNGDWSINNPSDLGGNSLGYVSAVCCDNNGYIWAALELNPEYKKLAVYNGNKWYINNDKLDVSDIFVMKADKDNRLWLGTGSGIQIINSTK